MNRKEAEAFFDKLEEGLKENFTIPKRKLSSSPSKTSPTKRPHDHSDDEKPTKKTDKKDDKIPFLGEGSAADGGSDSGGDPNRSQETSPKKWSAYDRKPPGNESNLENGCLQRVKN